MIMKVSVSVILHLYDLLPDDIFLDTSLIQDSQLIIDLVLNAFLRSLHHDVSVLLPKDHSTNCGQSAKLFRERG